MAFLVQPLVDAYRFENDVCQQCIKYKSQECGHCLFRVEDSSSEVNFFLIKHDQESKMEEITKGSKNKESIWTFC